LTRADTGLLLFVEDPSRTATRWTTSELDGESGVKILAALHEDLLATLPGSEGTTVYLAPATGEDAEYTQELADSSALALLEVPGSVPLQRWDSGLSILFNRYAHRKIMCVDASVPDISLEEISRARRKLDLYRMILGREGEDRCWLVGFNGYEEVLGRADVGPDDLLHPLLQAAGDVGLDVSLLDTKLSMRSGAQLEVLRALARHPSYPHLASVVNRLGLAGDSRARV
jgi:hypothetical protein